jgi:hypothetical protein
MGRPGRLSPEDIKNIRKLYAAGASRKNIVRFLLDERKITISAQTVYYHLGLHPKNKPVVKDYFYFLRKDCERRGVRFIKPYAREKRLWS